MSYMNSFGVGSSTGSGERGPRGYPGVSIDDITFDDNDDGTVTITIDMSDGTTYGPFTGTLVSDNIIALNKLSLEGTNLSDKVIIKRADNSNLVVVDTIANNLKLSNTTIGTATTATLATLENLGTGNAQLEFKTNAGTGSISMSGSGGHIVLLPVGSASVSPNANNVNPLGLSTSRWSNVWTQNLNYAGTMTTPLTANSLVQTNGSSQLTASNTLPSGLTLTTPTVSGVLTCNDIHLENGVSTHPRILYDVTDNALAFGINQLDASANTVVNGSLGGCKAGMWLGDNLNSSQFFIDLSSSSAPGITPSRRYNFLFDSFYPQVPTNNALGLSGNRWANVYSLNGNFAGTVNLGALSTSSLLQTNGSRDMITSNTLPSGCSATSLALTTPTVTGGLTSTGTTSTFQMDSASLTSPIRLLNNSTGSVGLWFQSGASTAAINYNQTGTLMSIPHNLSLGAAGTIINTGSGAITLNGPVSITSTNTFSVGSGAVNLGSGAVTFGTGTITKTSGNITLGSGLITSSQAGTAGANNVRMNLVNSTNSATAGTTVGVQFTATNSAGGAQQTGDLFYGHTNGWTFRHQSANGSGIVNQVVLSNTGTTAGDGTQITLQGNSGGTARTCTLSYNGTNILLNSSNTGGYFGPTNTTGMTIGSAGSWWAGAYLNSATIVTSDERSKNSIQPQTLGLNFICDLEPVTYKYNKRYEEIDENGNVIIHPGIRRHHGLIAQQVEDVMTDHNVTDLDFAGFIYDQEHDKYALRYEEFISPMIKAIQQLKAIVDTQQTTINGLLDRIDILENS